MLKKVVLTILLIFLDVQNTYDLLVRFLSENCENTECLQIQEALKKRQDELANLPVTALEIQLKQNNKSIEDTA